jgi:subtilase family serine protease
MKILLKPLSIAVRSAAVCSAVALCAALPAISQTAAQTAARTSALQPRLTAPIDNSSRATLTGSRPPRAKAANDIGAVPPTMKLQGISIIFSRTPDQQAALDNLVAAQQNPSSPLYHQWLTPDQFAAQFGVADADLAAVQSWLEQQGFSIDSVSRSRNRIFFSGNAGHVASAFGAPLHYYKGPTETTTHFAPSADLSVPAALSSSVLAITNLSDFRPRSHLKLRGPKGSQPRFTSGETGNHYLTPGDVATIYDITPAYNSGYTGSNQSLAIVGQSAISLTDISNFQTAVGIAGKTPIITLVPNSGASEVYAADSDEAESDLDLEYSSTIAKGAQVYFVYVGNSRNYSVTNSLEYAIDQKIAPVISTSYGECEPVLGQSGYNELNPYLEQAAAQGQTVVAAAGDNGSSDCYGEYSSKEPADNEQLAVDFPASSQYVTGMGGTEFPAADIVSGNNTYFAAETTTDIINSALSYIPEQVWNDDSLASEDPAEPLSAGAGGVSIFTPRPSWQTGTIGGVALPASGGYRMVPDIALTASPTYAPFAFCTSDTTFWATGQKASCNDGLRDAATGDLTVGGGTSFDAPTFAGLVAVINEAKGYTTGQGVVNSTLYSLAANTTTYASAFHDITSGGNECSAGATYCGTGPQTTDYVSTVGYDEASGLGSINFYNLLTAWPVSSGTSPSTYASSTTLTAPTSAPAVGATDVITITVASASTGSTAVPTGSVSVAVNGTVVNADAPLTNGVATYSFSSPTAGSYVITATYSGNSTYASSIGTLTVSVGGTTTSGSFTLTATSVSVAAGSTGSSTVTATPSGGYTGTITWSVTLPSTLTIGCYTIANLPVPSTAAVTTTMAIYTSAAACAAAQAQARAGVIWHSFASASPKKLAAANPTSAPSGSPWKRLPLPAAFAGTLMLVCFRRRSRLLRAVLSLGAVVLISVAGLGLTACGGSSSPASGGNAPTITFTVPNHTYGDAPFTVSATSNSSGAITYSVVSGPATISGSTVTLTGAGTVVLQASQAASGNYAAGTQNATFNVSTVPPPSTNSPVGTYTLTLIGTDSKTSTITNSTPLTLTVN